MNTITFSENLKHLRENEGLKQTEMHSAIGFNRTTWNGYETAKSVPSFNDLIRISQFFGILESDLIHTEVPSSDLPRLYDLFIFAQDDPELIGRSARSKQFLDYYNSNKWAGPQSGKGLIKVPRKPGKGYEGYKIEPDRVLMVSEPEPPVYNAKVPRVITVNERQQENIIYVPAKAYAGYLAGYGDPEFMATLPTYRMPGLDNGTYRMFEVSGPSMAPNIISGDRVIGQWLSSLEEIRENRVHIVVTRDGIVVKRILNRIVKRRKIVLKSDTISHRRDYPTYEIDPSDVLEIWYCRLKLSSDFSEPVEIYHRLADLESEMTEVKQVLKGIVR